jgi:biotin carboxylase
VSSPQPRVLLLLANNSYKARDFLSAIGYVDVLVTVGSDHEATLAEEAPDTTLPLDLDDVEGSVRQIVAHHDRFPLDAIIAAEDEGTVVAAAACQRLGLTHNPPASVRAARRKDVMRARLHEAGVPCPAHRAYPAEVDPRKPAREAPLPCVVKPASLSASRGVIRADTTTGVEQAIRRVRAILDQEEVDHPGRAARTIVVEEFVPGAEVSVEGLLVDGELHALAILDKPDPLDGPYFEETLFVAPSRLPPADQTAVLEAAAGAAAALGLREGPVHAELRINDDGVWLIEIAPRSIGGLCSRLFRYRSGISLEELILRHALGLPFPGAAGRAEEALPAAGVMMLPIPSGGVLSGVHGTDAAAMVRGIEDVVISIPPGEKVTPLPEGHRYLGFLFATGGSPEAVEATLRKAHAKLEFLINPVG